MTIEMNKMDYMNKALFLLGEEVLNLQVPFDSEGEDFGCKHLIANEKSIRECVGTLLDDIFKLAKD